MGPARFQVTPPLVTLRALCLLGLAAMAALGLWRLTASSAADLLRHVRVDGLLSVAELPFDEALIRLCSVALVASGAWAVLVTALLATEVVVGAVGLESTGARAIPKLTTRMCPGLAHRIVLAGCGVALTAGLTSPATADEAGQLDGLAMPDRTVGSPAWEPRPTRITVIPGASLWSIAKAVLPDQAGNAEIAAAWHAVHRANPNRIGNDPGLIFPRTTLRIPDLNALDRKDHQ